MLLLIFIWSGNVICPASKDRKQRYHVQHSSIILSYERMHLATSSIYFADNKSSYFRLFICVNINQVTALDRKWGLKEARKEDRRWLLIDCLRKSHCDSFNLKSRFLARCFRRWNVIFSLVWSEISFLRCSTVRSD